MIIPAYNEENRLPGSLDKIATFLSQQEYSAEVLVVENGSSDRTYEVASEFAKHNENFSVMQAEGRGKGLAVRTGMLATQGQYRFMCDADLSMPIEEINNFLPPKIAAPQIVIGSREAPGAVRYNEPEFRHFGGRGINILIRLLALPKLRDTQCGFKLFRADIAEDLFRAQKLDSWSFDIEVLRIARQRDYEIVELPVPWYYTEESHVNPIPDALKLIADLFTIRRNLRNGAYARGSHAQAH
ncbi:MAG: glycosyltransferase family 2 protein [Chloroflexi bacterium]|nr:MAG: glycosyltransferase family 2 protein [Chloroflexota bacterium]MBL1194457.1 glycosyltransferase family 2 protein [Chloroflexota bacterium]NOH11744.1 glycosyltransferase family 2 protein [Chloroflexota bacterium]